MSAPTLDPTDLGQATGAPPPGATDVACQALVDRDIGIQVLRAGWDGRAWVFPGPFGIDLAVSDLELIRIGQRIRQAVGDGTPCAKLADLKSVLEEIDKVAQGDGFDDALERTWSVGVIARNALRDLT